MKNEEKNKEIRVLSDQELGKVWGGLNPQPLPPRDFRIAFYNFATIFQAFRFF